MTTNRVELPGWLVALLCVASALLSISRAPAASPRAPRATGSVGLPQAQRAAPSHLPPGALADDGGPSRVIFPEQRIPLRFSHRKHVLDLGVTCVDCHTEARSSRQSRDRLLPAATRCDRCHASDHSNLNQVTSKGKGADSSCVFCHVGHETTHGNQVNRVNLPVPNLKFDHRVHAERNIGCAQCHGAVERVELASRDQLPRMRGCLSCHGQTGAAAGAASGECATCHMTDGPRLKTKFASGVLVPPNWLKNSAHGPDWLLRHRSVAGDDSRFCGSCHKEKECVDCHDGRVRPRAVHPNDFLSMHGAFARNESPRCSSCHQKQSFCLSCHQRSGVSASGPAGASVQRGRFHPPASLWTNGPRSTAHHASEAQRNLNACISCHTERDCVGCHSTRGVGGPGGLSAGGGRLNPHPRGFRSRCAQALRQNARPCLTCHEPQDANLSACR